MEQKQDLDTKKEEVPEGGIVITMISVGIIIAIPALILSFIWNVLSGEEEVSVQPVVARCLVVPDFIELRLNDGLNIDGGGSIRNLQAVKSNDYESVYFISGDLQGAGLEGDTDIATFATNKLDTTGMTFSIDAVAAEFSDWPKGSETNFNISIGSDGVRESVECVRNI